MKRLLPLLLSSLLFTVSAYATCAVAVWTPGQIVLGADSMERIINPADSGGAINDCKIQQAGNYYVMISGITRHRKSGFDTFAIISASIHRSTSISEAADMAMSEIERGFLNVLILAKQNNDARYMTDLETNSPTFVIAGFEAGRGYMVYCSFDKIRGHWKWTRAYYPDGTGDSVAYAYLCGKRGVNVYKHDHPNWLQDDPERTITGMIAAETRIAPREVGGPLALMVLDKTGPHWRSGGVCGSNR